MNSFAFKVGDIVKVFTRDPQEGRVHAVSFEGVVISKRGEGTGGTFTVRKVSAGKIAIERIFSLDSPTIEKISVLKKGKVRRAKLYYMRKRKQS